MKMLHFNIPKNTFGLFISNAEQDDLWESLTEVAHLKRSLDASLSVKKIMDTWTLQMGYPVINVQRDNVANTIPLSVILSVIFSRTNVLNQLIIAFLLFISVNSISLPVFENQFLINEIYSQLT